MVVNEDNKYIAVIMRHDLDRGAYSYSLVGAAKTMASATALARKAKDVEYKDVIAVLEYEGISDIGKHAKKIFVVDKKLNRLQILQVKTKHDQSNNVSSEELANSWIEAYEKLSFPWLLEACGKYVDRKLTTQILCEYLLSVLDKMMNSNLADVRSVAIEILSWSTGRSNVGSWKLREMAYAANEKIRLLFAGLSYNINELLYSFISTADFLDGYNMRTGVIVICNSLFSVSGYDISMVDEVKDRFVSLMPLEDFLLILAKSERPKGN